MPTAAEEAAAPHAAYQAYEDGVRLLRTLTRSEEKYPLVASTNRDFGFCRNTWAMKWIGLPTSLAVAGVVALRLHGEMIADGAVSEAAVGVLVVSVLLAAFWAWVNTKWVQQAAERYAFALLETLDLPADD